MQYLKADTTTTVIIGPIAGTLSADEVSLWKHNNTTEIDISGTANITQVSNQMYSVDLVAGNLDTEGRLNLYIRDDSESIHYAQEFTVINAAMYDWMYGADGYNATIKLKQLDIQNSAGTAFITKSTGGNGKGFHAEGNGSGAGIEVKAAGTGAGIKIWGGGYGIHFFTGDGVAIYANSKGFIEHNGTPFNAAPSILLEPASTGGDGIKIVTRGIGVNIQSWGTGIYSKGGFGGANTGHGAFFEGGEGGGDGIRSQSVFGSQSGTDGIRGMGASVGDNGYGMSLTGGAGDIDASEIDAAKNDAGASKEQATLSRKILANKAVQNKNTGVIEYYDDDDETVILTHTPVDTESEITRNAS